MHILKRRPFCSNYGTGNFIRQLRWTSICS